MFKVADFWQADWGNLRILVCERHKSMKDVKVIKKQRSGKVCFFCNQEKVAQTGRPFDTIMEDCKPD